MTRIKICCISNVAEAQLAIRHGAHALGLVSAMPSGPGVIPESLIADIVALVPPPVATFLLTSHQDIDLIIAQQRRCKVNTLQLVDALPPGSHAKLRRALPGVGLVQVIHVNGESTIAQAADVAPSVDALLLDSGNPSLAVKELGGTGRAHNWDISRRLVAEVPVPVFLAGGLRAGNVAEALNTVAPFGVDVCTGVRTDGALDDAKLSAFVEAAGSWRRPERPITP